jgi:AraC-like DNA-binding protein
MHHVLASLRAPQSRGFSPRSLLTRAGINPQLVGDPSRRVHTDQVARLFKLIQLELDDEFMGFTANPCRVGVFRIMCDLVKHSRTLGEMLEQAAEFYSLIGDNLSMALEKKRGRAVFRFSLARPELDPEHFLAEFLLVIWHRFPSWYIGEAIRLRETHFAFPEPQHRRELQIMFPGKLQFDRGSNQLVFDAVYLDKPLVRSNAELTYFVRNAPADVMTIPGVDSSLERQIERIIENRSDAALVFPGLDEVAMELGIGAQTLYRQLRRSGTSYQKIKDDIRRETAIGKLVEEGLPVERVSEIVGFSEARSFTRAFRQWTGMAPREYCQSIGRVASRRGSTR